MKCQLSFVVDNNSEKLLVKATRGHYDSWGIVGWGWGTENILSQWKTKDGPDLPAGSWVRSTLMAYLKCPCINYQLLCVVLSVSLVIWQVRAYLYSGGGAMLPCGGGGHHGGGLN